MIKRIHHIGIVVRKLDEAFAFYRDALGLHVHKQDVIPDQGVKAALLTLGDSEIELLEPIAADTGIARFLERRGEGMHHVCFETDDVERELEGIKAKGVEVIDQKPRPGLAGMICFLHPRASHGVLVELAQPPAEERAVAPPLPKLAWLSITVKDLEGAVQTYERNFGLKIGQESVEPVSYVVYDPEGVRVWIWPAGPDGQEGLASIELHVSPEHLARLRQAGIKLIGGRQTRQLRRQQVETETYDVADLTITHGVRLSMTVWHPR